MQINVSAIVNEIATLTGAEPYTVALAGGTVVLAIASRFIARIF